VTDIEGVRRALGLGPIRVLGISWGGVLGLMYAARHSAGVRTLSVVGASASRGFLPSQRSTPGHARAVDDPSRSLEGSLPDDEAFRRAFETIRSLYVHDQQLVAAANASQADTRHRLAVRNFAIHHEHARYDCRPQLALIRRPTLVRVGRHDWICPWTRPRRSTD
jgi:proline iminopeptidase